MLRPRFASTCLVLTLCASAARAQVISPLVTPYPRMTFSFDAASPSVNRPSSFGGTPMQPADILTPGNVTFPPFGPPPWQPGFATLPPPIAPMINSSSVVMGIAGTELDAESSGLDSHDGHADSQRRVWWFSVDRFAVGIAGLPTPSVFSEAPGNDAAADVFIDLGLPPGPLTMPAAQTVTQGHVAVIDGNGRRSVSSNYVYPAINLLEPLISNPTLPTDDLDGLNVDAINPAHCFFSLSSVTAPSIGAVGGEILISPIATPGGPFLYITANQLGLDLINGPNSDDLDALALRENGSFGLQLVPTGSHAPAPPWWEWPWGLPDGEGGDGGEGTLPPDVLFFSVRNGSAVIGQPDSRFGLPIEPGDILTPPLVAGQLPGIWVAAENLGLRTRRIQPQNRADELDALDISYYADSSFGLPDCDGNGVFDAREIAFGTAVDADLDLNPYPCDI